MSGVSFDLSSVFRTVAEAVGDQTFLVWRDRRFTYAEFDARVDRLAWRLLESGVGPESLVGLAIRRSVDLVVGMYAILRAGGVDDSIMSWALPPPTLMATRRPPSTGVGMFCTKRSSSIWLVIASSPRRNGQTWTRTPRRTS